MQRRFGVAGALLMVALVVVMVCGVGCPPQTGQKSTVTVLLASDLGGAKSAVDVSDILSLTVTVTEISLDPADDDPIGGEGEGEGEGEVGTKAGPVVIFSGTKDVNILDLSGISEVLSSADVEAGQYTKIRLAIENPRLVYVDDPETEVTDIQLTANGHLFVSESFEIAADQSSLILLDFNGIHLVQTGNGKLVWTPQLRATIEVNSADAVVAGVIQSVDSAANTMTVAVVDSDTVMTVDFSGAAGAIFLPEDIDTPTGTPADLVVGVEVQASGLLTVDGSLNADTIAILSVPEPEPDPEPEV